MAASKTNLIVTITVASLLPTVITWVYFVTLSGSHAWLQQFAYSVGKTIQFALPAVWVLLWSRAQLRTLLPWVAHRELARPNFGKTTIWGWSIGFGLLAGAGVFIGYYALIQPFGLADRLIEQVHEKVAGMSLDSPAKFIALGAFYALVHSLMEEYYWRWFVYVRLREVVSDVLANLISSIGFALHHVILLGTFLGWDSPMTYVLSAAVAVGGAAWAWMYRRCGTLGPIWASHMIVDAAIFTLGYQLVF